VKGVVHRVFLLFPNPMRTPFPRVETRGHELRTIQCLVVVGIAFKPFAKPFHVGIYASKRRKKFILSDSVAEVIDREDNPEAAQR